MTKELSDNGKKKEKSMSELFEEHNKRSSWYYLSLMIAVIAFLSLLV